MNTEFFVCNHELVVFLENNSKLKQKVFISILMYIIHLLQRPIFKLYSKPGYHIPT